VTVSAAVDYSGRETCQATVLFHLTAAGTPAEVHFNRLDLVRTHEIAFADRQAVVA
jgi:hypothetical protein